MLRVCVCVQVVQLKEKKQKSAKLWKNPFRPAE